MALTKGDYSMQQWRRPLGTVALASAAALVLFAGTAMAQDAAPAAAEPVGVSSEVAFIFNTFSFLITGALVMWMAAGFAMLESGLVRTKNTASICLKNIALYAFACIMYYIIGYNLMYGNVDGGYIGSFSLFYNSTGDELALIGGSEEASVLSGTISNGYAIMSDWFFQVVFVATAASIVSGTIAERMKIWPFMLFTIVLTAVLYPIVGAWTWGGGWLSEMGFSDFAGSTIVHSTGGWAALTGALIVGARKGKFGPGGQIHPMPGSNLPLATLGTFILWLGWFGFNGGSQLALGSALDAAAMAVVFVNTNLAACAGVVVAMILTQILYKKIDLSMALNGAIGGLVAITAGPDLTNHLLSLVVGGIGGVLVVICVPLVDKLRIDDVVGAISAHLVCGIWGTLAVGIFGGGDFIVQLIGVVAVGVFMVVTSGIVWFVLQALFGLRVSEEEEELGLDRTELGMEAYPEFGHGSKTI